ncbi:hypothetical protein [Burkholderia anthina]|jgi:hypothetical protein|uniref:hypothetical protein n=1 Tax=Burkholderia anthina TaxID=179879 RepID=UPI00158CF14C
MNTQINSVPADIEPANFTAVRPTARAIGDFYLQKFHPGARASRDPVPLDTPLLSGATHRFDFTTATGAAGTLYLGIAASGGWEVKARKRFASDVAIAA